eukprot:Opistho-2@58757
MSAFSIACRSTGRAAAAAALPVLRPSLSLPNHGVLSALRLPWKGVNARFRPPISALRAPFSSTAICRFSKKETNSGASAGDGNDPATDTPVTQHAIASIKPMMQIFFTCRSCETRTTKRFSKHSYTKGIVMIKCPGCEKLHLIADNIGWFNHFDGKNIEDFLAQKGESVKFVKGDEAAALELTVDDIAGASNPAIAVTKA